MGWKVNLKDDKVDSLGQARCVPGWYLATIEDAKENPETSNLEFDFRIKAPTLVGVLHKEFLNNPELQDTEEKTAMSIRKAKDWGARLGLITKANEGDEDFELDWAKVIGKEVVLHLKDGSYTNRDGKRVDLVRADWAPYPLDHQGVSADARQLLGLPLLPGQTLAKDTPKPARKPKATAKEAVGAGANGSAVDPSAIDVSDV